MTKHPGARLLRTLILPLILLAAAAAAHAEGTPQIDPRTDSTDRLRELLRVGIAKLYPAANIELTGPARWTFGSLPSKLGLVRVLSDDGRGNAFFEIDDVMTGKIDQGTVSFAAWVKARIAVRRIMPGEKLAPELFMSQDLDVASGMPHEYRGVIFASEDPVGGLEATQTVLEGQFLATSGVKRVPDVRRGDMVRIQLVSGSLRLSTQGTAEEPGYREGAVRVLTRQTKRELVGTLKRDGVVEVRL